MLTGILSPKFLMRYNAISHLIVLARSILLFILSSNTRLIENTFISNHETERKKFSPETCDWKDFSCPSDRQNCLFVLFLYGTSHYAALSLHFIIKGLFVCFMRLMWLDWVVLSCFELHWSCWGDLPQPLWHNGAALNRNFKMLLCFLLSGSI